MTHPEITRHIYPAEPAEQQDLIRLWRSEWSRTDYDWVAALHGDYSATLNIVSLIARVESQPVASATVNFAKKSPEVCLLGNVVTLKPFRRQGIGVALTNAAVDCGFQAGCQVAYLGSSRLQGNVYERSGFERLAGYIMRRTASEHARCESEWFAAGQATNIRSAVWGDMPGLVSLLTQPLQSAAVDYPRGLMSIKHADPVRCVSAFAVVHDQIQQCGGVMQILASREGSRVFGLGTLTPDPAPSRAHRAVVDVATHDEYHKHMDEMLNRLREEATRRGIEVLRACVAASDVVKTSALSQAGFQLIASMPAHFRLRSGTEDALLLELK